jgi:hypothetical protein
MSEVLQITKALSDSSDADLVRVIGVRLIPTSTCRDFFDLATALIRPQSVLGAISGLTKKQIIAFDNLMRNENTKANASSLDALATLFLVAKTGSGAKAIYKPYESATANFKQLVTPKVLAALSDSVVVLANTKQTDQGFIDSQAGISAFETVQAITELVIELEQRYVKEVGRGQVGLPELKRLALHLGRDVDYARLLYSLAQMASLIGIADKRWQISSEYSNWLTSSTQERWQLLASAWLTLLGEIAASELAGTKNLKSAFAETFPLANEGVLTFMSRLSKLAELIGITSGHEVASWFKPLLEGKSKEAFLMLQNHLPKIQNKIIVQADLTIIAVGPLPTDKELKLRRFVETERIGIASTYRISTLSVTFGLETGLTEADIRALLTELSGIPLPQPVDYLIKEAACRFGRLVLVEIPNGTHIQSSESILLTQILNDSTLRTISIIKVNENTLESRFEQDIVYYQLRESKYAAIRKDSAGEVISSWRKAGSNQSALQLSSSTLGDIQRWREHDKRLGEAPEGQDIVRQLEMAIKTKGSITVSIQVKGEAREFTIEPTGLINGRLRGMDRKADCERVLPLASITGVRLG